MSKIHWEPTAHLRFVEKMIDEFPFPKPKKVLQQKWVQDEDPWGFRTYAWRDVPLEEDQ